MLFGGSKNTGMKNNLNEFNSHNEFVRNKRVRNNRKNEKNKTKDQDELIGYISLKMVFAKVYNSC